MAKHVAQSTEDSRSREALAGFHARVTLTQIDGGWLTIGRVRSYLRDWTTGRHGETRTHETPDNMRAAYRWLREVTR